MQTEECKEDSLHSIGLGIVLSPLIELIVVNLEMESDRICDRKQRIGDQNYYGHCDEQGKALRHGFE